MAMFPVDICSRLYSTTSKKWILLEINASFTKVSSNSFGEPFQYTCLKGDAVCGIADRACMSVVVALY